MGKEREKEKKEHGCGGDQEKQAEKPLGEAGSSEERGGSPQAEVALGGGQAEKGRQAVWYPEKGEGDLLTHFGSGIASQPLIPGQAVMRTLSPGNRRRGESPGFLESRLHLDFEMVAMQTQAGVPLVPSGPVSPEEGSRAYRQRMKQDAHLAWFGRGPPVPLALVAQGTRTAVANAGGIDDPQAAITLSTLLMRDQDIACRTS